MRSDLILPALLAVALTLMVAYAATGDGKEAAELAASPLACGSGKIITSLTDLPEASGLAKSHRTPQLFWSHNDSAGPYVYAVTADGSSTRVRVAGASAEDWEAVAIGPCLDKTCLFIGDIGDNDRARAHITVYRTVEPSPAQEVSEDAIALEAVYPEGPQDAEAMFVADGELYIVTKGEGTPIRLYRFPALDAGTRHTLQLVAQLTRAPADKTARVTDAAVSPDNHWIALRTNDQILFYEWASLRAGQPGTPLSADVRGLNEPQGEGVAWADAQTLFLAGEGEGGGTFASLTCRPH